MRTSRASQEVLSAFEWTSYSVRRSAKAPLLEYVTNALAMRGCRVLFASEPIRAPFYVVYETPAGDRQGVLVYAFFANSKSIKNRPVDERRFQIKYGGNLKGILEVGIDPRSLVATIFVGIDLDEGVFVAADPLINTPAPI